MTSAVPELIPYRVWLCVLTVTGISVANLRGIRESGRLFAMPTYLFVASILGMVGYGLAGAVFDFLPEAPYAPHPPRQKPSSQLFERRIAATMMPTSE